MTPDGAWAETWIASQALPDAVRDAVRGILVDTWPQDEDSRKDDDA